MKKKNKLSIIAIALFALLFSSCYSQPSIDPGPVEPEYLPKSRLIGEDIAIYSQMLGRYVYDNEEKSYEFFNGVSGFEVRFTGTCLKAKCHTKTLFNGFSRKQIEVLVDGQKAKDGTILTVVDSLVDRELAIVDGLENVEHTVRVIKRHSSYRNSFCLSELMTDGLISKHEGNNKLKIEVYGDSITCGEGVLRTIDDQGNPVGGYTADTESTLNAYAYKAAEKLDAEINVFGRGGIALHYKSPNQHYTVEENYDCVAVDVPEYKWDYSYRPDVVIIYLGTNDYNAARIYNIDGGYDGNVMKQAFVDFIYTAIYGKYGAGVKIILCAGMMVPDSDLVQVTEQVADRFSKTDGHYVTSISFEATPYGHPIESEDEIASEKLANHIREVLNNEE